MTVTVHLLLALLLAGPAHLTPGPAHLTTAGSAGRKVRDHKVLREKQDSIKVVISEGCISDPNQEGKEVELVPGAPLVLTHHIKLVPSGPGPAACGCEETLLPLRERLERLERELSALREVCGGVDGGCCSSKESKGAGCSIQPDPDVRLCPSHCSDQGRCVDGRCVCFPGFHGDDCSQSNCPGNCHNRGRCVDGACVCDPGYAGPDCSQAGCPGNCSARGRCVNGECVCEGGFSGPSCAEEKPCPGNCNGRGRCSEGACVCDGAFAGPDCSESSCREDCGSRGRCVDGLCVCSAGFTGADCSSKSCPANCAGHGTCVNGRCACDVGFAGPDCSAKGCPGNCNGRGRCVKGRCVCRRGFTGSDCGQCEEGKSGPNCDTVLSVITQLTADDITETSATLVWTPPPVQYQTYHITFTSQKESDQRTTSQVEGSVVSFTQNGLAAGQKYTATVTGETDGRTGAASTVQFMTLIPGPTNLEVVKTTTTSAVVQWEQAQGEIDRYRLTVSPKDGVGKSQEIALPPERDSAHIEHLQPGRMYDITLVAERGANRSKAATTHVSPGPEPPTDLVFHQVSDNSLTLSWTKPKAPVSSFKVSYMHTEEGEPVSVSVGSEDSTLDLSQLSPGSSYEVSVISVLGLDESDPIKDLVMTLPDPPTDLRALNVTDTRALLLWRPALAPVDKYSIVYSTENGPDLKITISGNTAEMQLDALEEATTYTVTITSLLGNTQSSAATTTFTSTAAESVGNEEGPKDLQASQVTPRTALLSWKLPSTATAGRYTLTYQTQGQEAKEVMVGGPVTEYKLTRLRPASLYTVTLQGEGDGRLAAPLTTQFTTGTLRFPFPTDCSQELLNRAGESGEVEIFPQGSLGAPLPVYCDMETDGGGWTVFQRRRDGSVNFFRGWKDYSRGFGDLRGEFWLGLENLHNLTSATKMTLRVDLRSGNESVFAKYSTFQVAKKNYRLTVAGYSGTAGDSLSYHNNRLFSTKDRDPTPFITRCAMSYRGGWWYKNCHQANLNGLHGVGVRHQGVIWTTWKGKDFSVPFTEMKMRPSDFIPPTQ